MSTFPFRSVASLTIAFIASACSSSSETATGVTPPPKQYDANGCIVQSEGKVEQGSICVRTLAATVTDLDGKPLAELVTTACGSGCTYGKTDANGVTRMDVRRYMIKPALMLHGRSRWASYYSRFDAAGDIDRGRLYLPVMPFDQGVDLPKDGAAGTVTFGDVTLRIAAGTAVKIDEIELDGAVEQRFRVVSVPLDKTPPFVTDAGGGFAAVYAMTPFGTHVKPGVAVTIANTAKLPSGSAVELFQQGTSLDDSDGPFGGFSKVAEGHVSPDGATITTDEGQSVTQITWLGVRAKTSTN